MERYKWLLVFLVLVLSGCAPDPRNQADADRTRILAEQTAADLTQERTQEAARFDLETQRETALQDAHIKAQAKFIQWFGTIGTIAACISVLAGSVAISWGAIGTGKAISTAAAIRGGLIKLDNSTRQFPLIISYIGHGRFTLANPNLGSIANLDTRREEHRQLIITAGAVQLAGAVAHEARLSSDPGSVAIIAAGVNHETL